jgi:hypothetical protein
MRPDQPDPGQVAAGYPRVDYAPLYLTTQPDDAYTFGVDTPGLVLDGEPITHDAGDFDVYHDAPVLGGVATPPDVRAHMLSRGADVRESYGEPQERATDEEPRTERWSDGKRYAPSVTASLRGSNSLSMNNPEGFPTGTAENGSLVKRFYHRRMPHERFIHTERWLHPVHAAEAVNSPAMAANNSNRYTSPFAWLSFYGTRNWQRPIMRRNPPDTWDDQTNDGTQEASEVPADWVIG